MADRKISDLTALTTPASGDYLPIVDISEASAANKNKRITIEELLRGAPDGTAAAPGIAFESDPDSGLYSTGANAVAISTGGTGRLFIDSSGNVGVGTTSPNGLLDVRSATTWIGDGTTDAFLQFNQSATAADRWHIGAGTSNALIFYKGTYGSGSETARIDSSGRLLVGTSSPLGGSSNNGFYSLVQIRGNTAGSTLEGRLSLGTNKASNTVVSGSDLGAIWFQDGSGGDYASIQGQGDGTAGTNDYPGRLVFSTTADGTSSPTERMRITSAGVLQIADAGNIAVGTTTGTKIGTATTQKLGFFNKTPVVQPAAVADATDAASVITQLNALLARMRDLGLIAT